MTESELSKALFDLLSAYSDGTPKSVATVAKVINASLVLASNREEIGTLEIENIQTKVLELFDIYYQNGEGGVTPPLVESLLKSYCNTEVKKIKYDLTQAKGGGK